MSRSTPRTKAAVLPPAPTLFPLLAAVFGVALGLRLVHLFQMRATPLFTVLMGDSRGYDEWARRLAAGDWLGTEVFYQAPLYPYFMGVIYATLGSDPFVVRLVQAVIGGGSCAALAYAGARFIGPGVGLVAGIVLALYPAAIFFDALIQKSALDLFFTCGVLALLGAIVGGTGRWRETWFALGLTLAALSLTRENALLMAAAVVAWALVRRQWVPAALLVGGMAVLFIPVAARNAALGGGLYLTTSQFGSNFYIGNNADSDGTYMSLREGRGSPEFERKDATELAEQAAGRPLTPAEVSSYWFERSLAYIRSDTSDWLRLLARKAALLVNAAEMLDTESQESHAEHSTVLGMTSLAGHFGVLIPLAVSGVVVSWSRRRELLVVYVLAGVYAASVVVFFVMARYRHPLLPFLVLFAAAGLAGAPAFVRTAPRPWLAAAAAAVVIASFVSNRTMLSSTLMRAITEHNLATALQEQGRLDEAQAHYHRALAIQPDYAPAYNNLGTALMAKGDVEGAIAAFRQSYRLQPNSASARDLLAAANYDLGSELIARGEFTRAETALREAVRLNPQYAQAHNNLGIALASTDRLDEAVQHWQQALKIDPGLDDARRNLALALQQQR